MWFDHLPWNTIPWLTRILLGKRWSPCWNLHLQPDEQTSRSSGHSNDKSPMWPMQDKPWRRLDLFSSLPLPFWHPLSKITPQSSNRIHLGKYYSQFPNHWNYSYLFFFFFLLSNTHYPRVLPAGSEMECQSYCAAPWAGVWAGWIGNVEAGLGPGHRSSDCQEGKVAWGAVGIRNQDGKVKE